METISTTNQEAKSDLKDTPELLSSELQDLKKKVENPEVHTSFANMIGGLFNQAKEGVAKIGETGKETFTGIFKNAGDIAKYGANQVQEGAKTVVDEVKKTETVKKAGNMSTEAINKTTNIFKESVTSVIEMGKAAIPDEVNEETEKLNAEVNMQKVQDIVGVLNIQNETWTGAQETMIAKYNETNALLANPSIDWSEVAIVNQNLKGLIDLYEETLKKADNINPIPNDLNKISSDAKVESNKEETKVIPLNPETEIKAAA